MNLPPFEHLPNALQGQPIVCINYLNVVFPHPTCCIHAVVTLHTIRWKILSPTTLSVDSSGHTFHKPILALLTVSKNDSTLSPTAISGPVGVYVLGRLCIQWCQIADCRAAVGLCTVCALAPLDISHSTVRLNWSQLHWVTENLCVCYSLTECCRQSVWYNW
jgi:hypothetical protein